VEEGKESIWDSSVAAKEIFFKKKSWGLFCFGENGRTLSSTCPPLCFRQLASHSPWEFLFWELLGK
jgi:hypothetical protein